MFIRNYIVAILNYFSNLLISITIIWLLPIQLLGQKNNILHLETTRPQKYSQELDHDNYPSDYTTYYKIGIVSAATGLLFLADNQIRGNLKLTSKKRNNLLLEIGHGYGYAYYNFALIIE